MGTHYSVQFASFELTEAAEEHLVRAIQDELDLVDERMSTYRVDSELSKFNRWESEEPFRFSPETFAVFEEAFAVHRITKGAFDITVGPLVRLWGFGPEAEEARRLGRLPSEAELEAVGEKLGLEQLKLSPEASGVSKRTGEVECDLSGIAKGYAVDRLAQLLSKRGLDNFMVEVGGEVRTRGTNSGGEPWRIAIEKPQAGPSVLQRIVPLSDASLATSGDYRNFYQVEGKLYSHLLDPRTLRPVDHPLASVSVVSESCMRADGLASGLLVLGPEEGYRVAVEEELAALFLIRGEDGSIEERPTPAFERQYMPSALER